MAENFDVAVLGAGPGGYAAALRSAGNGLKTLLIDKEQRLGGTCLLRGCIPTKTLLETARRLDEMAKASVYGITLARTPETGGPALDFPKLMQRKERVVSKLAAGISGLCQKAGVRVMCGTASLEGKGSVRVVSSDGTETEVTAANIILATGSRVRHLPGLTPDHRRILTSDSALELDHVPRRLAVLGSGAVGLEFASAFRSFGSEVTVIEAMDRLLPSADAEISDWLHRAFRRRRISVFASARLEPPELTDSGVHLRIQTAEAGRSGSEAASRIEELDADALLVAVGREACVDGIGLDSVGIVPVQGRIPVDAQMRTSAPGIYAIGDLTASPALAHVATHEGLIAADAIAGLKTKPLSVGGIPSCVYSSPETASVGLTEEAAVQQGMDIIIGRFPFAAVGRASVLGETDGFAKLVARASDGRILGAHLAGPHAAELIGEFCAALSMGASLNDIADTIHAHPTLSEICGEAAMAALGRPLNF